MKDEIARIKAAKKKAAAAAKKKAAAAAKKKAAAAAAPAAAAKKKAAAAAKKKAPAAAAPAAAAKKKKDPGLVVHKYSNSVGSESFFPNPLGFTEQQNEIDQYKLMEKVTGAILRKNANYIDKRGLNIKLKYTADDIIDSAYTKTEALIAPGSLAICRVFGPKKFTKYLIGKGNGGVLPWRLISAYEMLCNMKMHEHNHNIKTKYVGRFTNTMPQYTNNCANIALALAEALKHDEMDSKTPEKNKMEEWSKVSEKISAFIDLIVYHDSSKNCTQLDTKAVNRPLDDDLTIMYNFILQKYAKTGRTKAGQILKVKQGKEQKIKRTHSVSVLCPELGTDKNPIKKNGKTVYKECSLADKIDKKAYNKWTDKGVGLDISWLHKTQEIDKLKEKMKSASAADKKKINRQIGILKLDIANERRSIRDAKALAAQKRKERRHTVRLMPEFHQFVLEF